MGRRTTSGGKRSGVITSGEKFRSKRISKFGERVLERIASAEWREVNPHYQDDYRIAWITVLRAGLGEREPDVSACYTVLGLHPNKVWPAIVARRHAIAGDHYEEFFGEKSAAELVPKKPPASVRPVEEVKRRRVGEEFASPVKANGAGLVSAPPPLQCPRFLPASRRQDGFASNSIPELA